MLMYMATIPSYNYKSDKNGGKSQEHIDADDPANKEKIEKLLFG